MKRDDSRGRAGGSRHRRRRAGEATAQGRRGQLKEAAASTSPQKAPRRTRLILLVILAACLSALAIQRHAFHDTLAWLTHVRRPVIEPVSEMSVAVEDTPGVHDPIPGDAVPAPAGEVEDTLLSDHIPPMPIPPRDHRSGVWDIGMTPQEMAERIRPLTDNWRYHSDDGPRPVTEEPIDWKELSKRRLITDTWVGGNWHTDYRYRRSELLHWLNERITQRGEQQRHIHSDIVAALQLALHYDQVLAAHLAEAELRIVAKDRDLRSLRHCLWRLAITYHLAGMEEPLADLLADPVGFVPRNRPGLAHLPAYADATALLPASWRLLAGELGAITDESGPWRQLPYLLTRAQKGLGADLSEQEAHLLREEAQRLSTFLEDLEQPILQRLSSLDDEEVIGRSVFLHRVLGRFNDLVADHFLYLLEQRGLTGYYIRPQEMIYIAVHIHRTYRRVRALPVLAWIQKAGIKSPQESDRTRYHDYFNAMEAATYANHIITGAHGLRRIPGVPEALWKLYGYSLSLAWDPEAQTLFKPTWKHRWMVVNDAWTLNRLHGRNADNEASYRAFAAGIPDCHDYYQSTAARRLADLYLSQGRLQEALPHYRTYARGEYHIAHVHTGVEGMQRIAELLGDWALWQEARELAQQAIPLMQHQTNINNLRSLINRDWQSSLSQL